MRTTQKMSRKRRGGYTLVELAISVGVGAVLLVGMGATMTIATRIAATPLSVEPTLERSMFAGEMKRDLESAIVVLNRTGAGEGIRCIVPDMNGDHRPDVIEYAWSGQKGSPLVCTVNGMGTDRSIQDIDSLNVTLYNNYRTEAIPRITRSQDAELFSHTASTGTKPFPVGVNTSISRVIDPRAFAGVATGSGLTYTLSQVIIYADVPSAAVGSTLQILDASSTGWPVGGPLATTTILSSHFGVGGKATVPIDTGALSFDHPIAIAIKSSGTLWSAEASSALDGEPTTLISKDDGATWFIPTDRLDLNFEVWGTVDQKATPHSLTRTNVKQAQVGLQLGQHSPTTFQVGFANRPEFCTDWIGFDGMSNPIGADYNLDGVSDFDNVSSFDFKDGGLVFEGLLGGHWLGTSRSDVNSPRILHLKLRDVGALYHVSLQVHCESATGQDGLFTLSATSTSSGVAIHWGTHSGGGPVTLGRETTTGSDLTVRLYILPENDSVTIELNRVVVGTVKYQFDTSVSGTPDVQIGNDGNGAIDTLSYQIMVPQ